MHRRQPLPRLWMMTDERQGEGLFGALRRLPEGAGIVFRHYSLPERQRRRLFDDVQTVARGKGCLLILAGTPQLAAAWEADGSHGWQGASEPRLLRSVAVHNQEEMEAANILGADLIFLSPVFETRSHPGRAALGPQGFSALAAMARMPVIALGGMDSERARLLAGSNIYGWAAIDAWTAGIR